VAYTGQQKREYQNAWMRKRRQAWIDENGPCIDCGSFEDLEVDHIDATLKEFNPTQLWSRRKEVRDLELAKCVVRCNSCHKIKTSKNKDGYSFGEDNHNSYLTKEIVDEIRNKYAQGDISIRKLAEEFNSKRATIHDIIRFHTWN
jgi:5-methylcytosine-specific restriction endonuclease McrA